MAKRIKSAIKRAEVAERNNQKNAMAKTKMRTAVKKAETAIVNKDTSSLDSSLKAAASILDRTARKGIIHKNKAARTKSHLAKKANVALKA